MGQIQLTISLILIGLFTVAIMGFAINFASDNDASISVADDAEMASLSKYSIGNLSEFSEKSEDTYKSIVNTTISPGSLNPQSSGPFTITPFNAIAISKNIMQVGYTKVFGTGTGFGIFITSFIGLFAFLFALYVYKTWRGNPD